MKQSELTKIIVDYLSSNIPIDWNGRLTGATLSNKVEGSVTCDRVDFHYDEKVCLVASATYKIYILDANSMEDVDELADKVFHLLNNDDLNGVLIDGLITNITYGSAQGLPKSGLVALTYNIEYYMEE